MPSKGALRGVLHNFLGTYTSRYTAYRGYWLCGFLVTSDHPIGINLLAPPPASARSPIETARRLAILRFSEQVRKARLEGAIEHASLIIQRGQALNVPASSRFIPPRAGFELIFTTYALDRRGQSHNYQAIVPVAPHDPRYESASAERP